MIQTLFIFQKKVFIYFSVDCIEDEYQEDQVQDEGIFFTPKNGTTIYLTVTTSSVLVSVDNTLGEYVSTIEPVDTPKPSSQPAAATSLSSRSTSKTASTSALY